MVYTKLIQRCKGWTVTCLTSNDVYQQGRQILDNLSFNIIMFTVKAFWRVTYVTNHHIHQCPIFYSGKDVLAMISEIK